jgi:hypothetical protein
MKRSGVSNFVSHENLPISRCPETRQHYTCEYRQACDAIQKGSLVYSKALRIQRDAFDDLSVCCQRSEEPMPSPFLKPGAQIRSYGRPSSSSRCPRVYG